MQAGSSKLSKAANGSTPTFFVEVSRTQIAKSTYICVGSPSSSEQFFKGRDRYSRRRKTKNGLTGLQAIMLTLRAATGGKKIKKKERSTNLLDRIEECDRAGQHTLDLAHLNLEDFPQETIIVPSIHVLLAYRNAFTKITSLSGFRQLEKIDLSRCNISNLDEVGFLSLHHLGELNLSRNSLTHLPPDIVRLVNLEKLLLDRNQLESFPEGMISMRSLKLLDASFNCLTEVGSSLEKIPLLDDLNLSGNPNLITKTLGLRTRRLFDKRALMSSKAERRILVQRALNVQRNVLTREQQAIFREIYQGPDPGEVDVLP